MTKSNSNLPDLQAIRAAFDREAGRYDQHAALEHEVGARLLERLSFQRREPAHIFDLGSGTGQSCTALKRRYRKATVVAVDASPAMSRAVRRRSGFFRPVHSVCADISNLPLASRCADLLFSNLALQWTADFHRSCEEFRRVLRPGGLLLFSTLGPHSLKEFRLAAGIDPGSAHFREFPDMHDIGDALLAAGFSAPVMDSEFIIMEYQQFDALMTELEATGVDTHFSDWSELAKAQHALAKAYQEFCPKGRYPVTWEIVYGAAFGPEEGQPIKTREGDIAAFSVDSLRDSLRRR